MGQAEIRDLSLGTVFEHGDTVYVVVGSERHGQIPVTVVGKSVSNMLQDTSLPADAPFTRSMQMNLTVGELQPGQVFMAGRTIYMVSRINEDGTVDVQILGAPPQDGPLLDTWDKNHEIHAVLTPPAAFA